MPSPAAVRSTSLAVVIHKAISFAIRLAPGSRMTQKLTKHLHLSMKCDMDTMYHPRVYRIAFAFALAAATLMPGCATRPVPPAERHSVASDRVFAALLLSPSTDRSARFTIVRDRGFVGSAAGIDAFVDGQRIARLGVAEAVTIYTTPGRHLLGARFS